MRKLLQFVAVALLVASLWPTNLLAQAETGQVVGTVTDPSGAVVPNAKVTVKNTGTGAERTVTTSASGDYIVTNLLAGIYAVTVEAAGFAKTEKRVELTVGAKVRLDFKLTLGAAVEVVEVAAAGGMQVNTQNQTLGTVISTRQASTGPSQDADPYAFVKISGNIVDDPSGRGVGFAINGQRSAGTNVLLDGAANNNEFDATRGQQVPLASVEEYTVLTSNFTAEYGRASAGVVNLVTKAGTNSFHGAAYEVHRDSHISANDFNNNAFGVTKPVYTRNLFGFAVGGPVKKNKLFFFQSTEWTRVRSSGSNIQFIADPELIAQAAANTQKYFTTFGTLRSNLNTLNRFTRADLIAQGFDPCAGADLTVADGLTKACASLPATTHFFDRVQWTVPSDSGGGPPQNTYDTVSRVDWNVSNQTQFYARYARFHELDAIGTVNTSPYAGFDTSNTRIGDNALLSVVHSIGAHWTTQSKFVYNRITNVQPLGQQPPGPTLYFSSSVAATVQGQLFSFPGYNATTPGSAIPFGGPQNFYQTYEDVSYTKGKHNWRFGGSYVFFQDNRTFGAYEEPVQALSTSSGIKAITIDRLLSGLNQNFTAAIFPQGKFPCGQPGPPAPVVVTPQCTVTLPVGFPSFSRSNRYNEFAFYGQDSWKVKPRLTLNLGLRWEYFGVQHNKNPLLDSNYYPGGGASLFERFRNGNVSLAPLSQIGGLWAKDWNNFGPRVGFAWDIFGNGRTALRGGYGLFYERNFGNVTFNVLFNPPNYQLISLTAGVDVPSIPITTDVAGPLAGTSGSKALPKASLRFVDPNIRTAYVHVYNASLEHQFGRGVFFALEYSGSNGKKLYSLTPVNIPGIGNVFLNDPCPTTPCKVSALTRTRPQQYGSVFMRGNLGSSNYNALNYKVQVQNVANSGLYLTANYTWSKTLDVLSSTFSDATVNINTGLLDLTNPHLDRGPADFDARHRFVVSATWEVPFARHTTGVFKQILDGWVIAPIFTTRTGLHFSIFDCTNEAFGQCPRLINDGTPISRSGPSNPPAVAGSPNLFDYIDTNGTTTSSYVNPITGNADFGPYPASLTGRGIFEAPGNWNLDLGIAKKFFVTERYKLEVRGEMFNTFNHANMFLAESTNDVAESSDGFVQTQKFGHRTVQFQLRFSF